MSIDIKNFKVSADMLSLSADGFKAALKATRPKMKVRDINAIYKSIHGFGLEIDEKETDGDISPVRTEITEDSE